MVCASPTVKKTEDKNFKDKKKRTNSLREKSGRNPGVNRASKAILKQVADPDEIIDILPEQCPKDRVLT